MSKPSSNHFHNTQGAKKQAILEKSINSHDIFAKGGHLAPYRIRDFREYFMQADLTQINHALQQQGYITKIRPSKHKNSPTMVIEIQNKGGKKNVSQVQISPPGRRHGLGYVKISTTDYGIIKIVKGKRKDYKSDGKEKSILIFERAEKK